MNHVPVTYQLISHGIIKGFKVHFLFLAAAKRCRRLKPIISFPVIPPPIDTLHYMRSDQMVKHTNLPVGEVKYAVCTVVGNRCSWFPPTQTKQTISAGNIGSKRRGKKKLVSRCQLLCLSQRFSFAHAWIFYQRELIRIKCLKAFLTPGDLNNFWLDLQTKQTIMMQACVKMYTAVKQQMPALDVFINVFSSSFHQLFFHIFTVFSVPSTGVTLCSLLPRCKKKKKQRTAINPRSKNEKKKETRRLPLFPSWPRNTQIPPETAKGIAGCSVRSLIRNIQIFLQSAGGETTILQKRCIF